VVPGPVAPGVVGCPHATARHPAATAHHQRAMEFAPRGCRVLIVDGGVNVQGF
jgi:hypothetical protein